MQQTFDQFFPLNTKIPLFSTRLQKRLKKFHWGGPLLTRYFHTSFGPTWSFRTTSWSNVFSYHFLVKHVHFICFWTKLVHSYLFLIEWVLLMQLFGRAWSIHNIFFVGNGLFVHLCVRTGSFIPLFGQTWSFRNFFWRKCSFHTNFWSNMFYSNHFSSNHLFNPSFTSKTSFHSIFVRSGSFHISFWAKIVLS